MTITEAFELCNKKYRIGDTISCAHNPKDIGIILGKPMKQENHIYVRVDHNTYTNLILYSTGVFKYRGSFAKIIKRRSINK